MQKPDFKNILGLDIGVASVGWSLIRSTDEIEAEVESIAQGVRIIRYKEEGYKGEAATFAKGGNISINKDRTVLRTVRKGLERYKMRKRALITALKKSGLLPENTDLLPEYTPLERWQKRADAANEETQIALYDLGRVLLHLNTKRGFQGSRKEDASESNENSKYKAAIKARQEKLQGRTIGQFLYAEMRTAQQQNKAGELHDNSHFDTKNQVYNRADYKAEFEQICASQSKYYPAILTADNIANLREIIYYQRPLKSQKHLISFCRYESREIEIFDKKGKGRKVRTGAKTAPLTNPLANVFRVWQTMLNIKINDGKKQVFPIENGSADLFSQNLSPEQIHAENDARYLNLFMAFCKKESLTPTQIAEALGFKGANININLQKNKSVKGFETHFKIETALRNAGITEQTVFDRCLLFDPLGSMEEQPLFRFWHILYSIETSEAAEKALYKQFGIKREHAQSILKEVTFKNDYASMSNTAMQRILEKMSKAHLLYSDAVAAVGEDDKAAGKADSVYATEGHSNSIDKITDDNRPLLAALETIKRNELRNPVVEKILNQVILLVNEIIKTHGKPDIIRIELARDLHKSAKERAQITDMNGKIEKEKKRIRTEIMADPSAAVYFANADAITDRDILKYRLWNEFDRVSPYEPDNIISLAELFEPNKYEIEHIVPRSLYYDDSFANKTLARRVVNKEKDNTLGLPFMQTFKNGDNLAAYKKLVEAQFKASRIGKRKYERLMAVEVPTEFANRELTFTRYIASETLKRMKTVWRNNDVQVTVGGITALLRKAWGLDTVIHDDRKADFEEKAPHLVEYKTAKNGNTYENIIGWDKRKDHRHHALDAFVVALTTRSMVKYFNDLNSEASKQIRRRSDKSDRKTQFYESPNPMLRRIADAAMQNIIISYKSGGRVASTSKHRRPDANGKTNKGITINPRGALHEDTIYGKKRLAKAEPTPLNMLKTELKTVADFERIMSPEHRAGLLYIFTENCKNDLKTFYKYFDKNAFTCGKNKVEKVHFAEDKYVKRDNTLDAKIIEKVIDKRIKTALQNRLAQYNNDPKKAFVELDKNPIYADETCKIPIKKVRILAHMSTGIKIPRGYVKSSSNHHLGIYKNNETPQLSQKIISFWEAFENTKQTGSPYIQQDADLGELLMTFEKNQTVVFGMTKEEIQGAVDRGNYRLLRKHIYRVQKLAINDFWFRMQYETELDDSIDAKAMKRFILITSLGNLTCIKIDVDILGRITKIYDALPIEPKKAKKV
jgi:CRISPR-associated endonuclease Csn1